jgi:hypothetical protein
MIFSALLGPSGKFSRFSQKKINKIKIKEKKKLENFMVSLFFYFPYFIQTTILLQYLYFSYFWFKRIFLNIFKKKKYFLEFFRNFEKKNTRRTGQ